MTGAILTLDGNVNVTSGGIMSVRSTGKVSDAGKINVPSGATLTVHHSSAGADKAEVLAGSINLQCGGEVYSQFEATGIPNSQRDTSAAAFTVAEIWENDTPDTTLIQFGYKYVYYVAQPQQPTNPGTSTGNSASGELISVDRTSGGSARVNPGRAEEGETVTITVDPNTGYELSELVVTDSRGNEIAVRSAGTNRYTFTMPSGRVSVEATFTRIGDNQQFEVTVPFTDVSASDYYYAAVQWAVEQGITSGTSATTFSPNGGCTRGQIVTFLYRAMA